MTRRRRADDALEVAFDPARVVTAIATGEVEGDDALVAAALLIEADPTGRFDGFTASELVESLREIERRAPGFLAASIVEARGAVS